MANATKSSSRVPVLDSDGNKIGTMNLVFPVHTVLPDFDELESTDDFGDPDTTNNTGSEYEPDVLDVLIEMEENPPEYEEDETAQVAAVGQYEKCIGFDFSLLLTAKDEVVLPYDTIAEPPVRAKLVVRAREVTDGCHGWRTRCHEANSRRRQCYFTKRHYATVRGAVAVGENVYVPRQQR